MKGKKFLAGVLSAAMVLGTMALPVFADDAVPTGTTGSVAVSGVKIAEGKRYGNIQDAYNEIKAELEAKAGLSEQGMSEEDFNAFFTEGGKITWTISGEQKVTDSRMFSFGRAANRFGDGRHITEINIVGDENAVLDLSAVNGTFALPYNWWNVADSANTALKCKNITFNGIKSMPSATYQCTLYPTTYEFDGCTFNGNLYSYQNFDVDMTIKNSTFNAPDNVTTYALMSQGLGGTITLDNNKIYGYTRGINLQRETADFIVTNNTIESDVSEPDRGAVQITDGKSFVVTGNTIDVSGGNAFWFHSAAKNSNATYTISENNIKAPYLANDDTTFGVNDKITCIGNIYNDTDILNCMEKEATEATKSTVEAMIPVAQIGTKFYSTLKDAIAAAQNGDTVTLANDVTESIKIDEGKAITLDLNGKTLTNTDGKHTIENYGTLVVEDGSQDKTGKVDNITNGRISFVNYEGGVATLNGGSFDRSMENGKVGATDDCNSCYTIKNWGIMTINENVSVNNKTDRQGGSSAIGNGYQNGANFDNHTNVTSANVKLTINGGKFTGGLNTIKNDDWAILEVNGGVFENNTQQCIMNWNEVSITGGIFTGEPNAIYNGYDNDSMDKGILEITGGEFNGNIQVYNNGTTSISGGTFNTDVSNYCASGFSPKLVNGKYVVDDSADTLKLTFIKHTDDERVYDIVLNGAGKNINRLNAAEFEFELSNAAMTYEIKAADKLTTLQPAVKKYVFYFDGKDAINNADTGREITIGTVTFEGFGTFTFKATAGKATATTTADNLVTEFVTTAESGKGTLKIGENDNMIKDAEIKVPTQKLTVNVAMEHNVGNNTEAYQDMTVAISGGNLAGNVLTYKLGNDNNDVTVAKNVNGDVTSYQIKADLTKERTYTVTVSGAGYRTSRYTVTMTEDKTMNFWNNDKTNEVTVIDDEKAKTTFLAGELVRDGKIDIYDLSAVVAYFGQKYIDKTQASKFAKYDLNRDGEIDIMDISIVLTSWGK